MPYFDVSIPFNLKTLTYKYDEDKDLTGYVVKVPLKNQLVNGLVIKKREYLSENISKKIKNIQKIIGQAYNQEFIEFLNWLSGYYLSETGSVLRITFFDEIVKVLEGKTTRKLNSKDIPCDRNLISYINEDTLSNIYQAVENKYFKTTLIHCPDISYEISLMFETVKKIQKETENILLILPEIKDAEILYCLLKKELNEKVVLLHSNMKHSEIFFSISKILKDEAKVIVGTRSAIFTPVKKLSIIMIAQESSWLYKAEETPRYHARDCAVMRGFIEKCPVILTDFMPSTVSYYNSIIGKYELLENFNIKKHPEIRILRQPYDSVFHEEILLFIKLYAKDGILITVPRVGYSLLRCPDCGELIRCEKCGNAMVYHKSTKTVECFRCGYELPVTDVCPNCQSINITPIGTGVEKIREKLKEVFEDKKISISELTDTSDKQSHDILVTTTSKAKKTYLPSYKGGVILDFDFFLAIPDYRAAENAFNKILSIAHCVETNGFMFIQTRNLQNRILKFIKSYNFKDFYAYEIKHRKETGFPPFARLIKIRLKTKRHNTDKIKELLKSSISGDIIGPHYNFSKDEFIFIIRSKDRKKIIEQTSFAIENLKKIKGLSIKAEVDPVFLRV